MRRGISVIAALAALIMGGALVLLSYTEGRDVYFLIAGLASMVFGGRAIEKISED